MFFKITSSHPKFSYILVKNPNGEPYKRDLSSSEEGARTVDGAYVGEFYQLFVRNDERKMTEVLKAQNKAFYVSSKPYAVNPYNLACITHALRSAINGNPKASALTDEEYYAPAMVKAVVGPFCAHPGKLRRIFEGCGFTVSMESDAHEYAHTLTLFSSEPRSTTEQLQRLVVASYAVSIRKEEGMMDSGQLDSLATKAKSWLAQTSVREEVTRLLTSYRKDQSNTFGSKLEGVEAQETVARDDSLHDLRHKAILAELPPECKNIVDLGCGDGKFLRRLLEEREDISILAIDADERSLQKLRRKMRVKTWHQNLLAPYLEVTDLAPDAMIVSEVIEHLEKSDRAELMEQIASVWQPKHLFLTTPNRAYNPILGLEEGTLRHKDHRIEYVQEQFTSEVLDVLSTRYELKLLSLLEGAETQPSFVLHATRKAEIPVPDMRVLQGMRDKHASISLEEVGTFIATRELRDGMTHPVYRSRRSEVFYLSPTMAPADYVPEYPDTLEHPEGAFAYYRNRGVTKIVEEPKHMGSRGHVLLFRTMPLAKAMGFDSQVISISRQGFTLLEPADAQRIADDLVHANWRDAHGVVLDFVALDCEVMPWSYKADGEKSSLIRSSFGCPGAAALLDKRAKGEDTANAEKFLTALSWFARKEDLSLAAFGLLAAGKIGSNAKTHRLEYQMRQWGIDMPHPDQLAALYQFCASEMQSIRATTFRVVDLTNAEETSASIARWTEYTTSGQGEGFVYKPVNPVQTIPDGSRVQHAIKVRGQDYLRLVYGMNYLEQMDMFKKRATGKKRYAALKEELVGRKLMRAFFSRLDRDHAKYLAGFLGMNSSSGIDATL